MQSGVISLSHSPALAPHTMHHHGIAASAHADQIRAAAGCDLAAGKYDHLPEAAFYMVGTIEEAVEKGKRLAAEAA